LTGADEVARATWLRIADAAPDPYLLLLLDRGEAATSWRPEKISYFRWRRRESNPEWRARIARGFCRFSGKAAEIGDDFEALFRTGLDPERPVWTTVGETLLRHRRGRLVALRFVPLRGPGSGLCPARTRAHELPVLFSE
jgi:hypothetical protein